jgi:hypothetical protein
MSTKNIFPVVKMILAEKVLKRKVEKVQGRDFCASGRYKHLLFKIHCAPFLSEQFSYSYRKVHLYVHRETEKDGSAIIHLAFIYNVSGLPLDTYTELEMLQVLYSPHEERITTVLHKFVSFISLSGVVFI